MPYLIDVVCSDPRHPVNHWLERWGERVGEKHRVRVHRRVAELGAGDFLFLVSCTEIVPPAVRERYRHALVLHGSDLPAGRGWSPVVWEVLGGATVATVSLIDAADPVDSGDVWCKQRFEVPANALVHEIDALLFDAEIALMDWALDNCDRRQPVPQHGAVSHYPRRSPADSRLDPDATIADQFDLLRVSDPERYPAFVDIRGRRFAVTLRALDE